MQVILDSPFARPGSAPIGGGKKGEFRDWTTYRGAKCRNTLSKDLKEVANSGTFKKRIVNMLLT